MAWMFQVDGNATNCRIICEMLLQWGMRPVRADSGSMALETMRQFNSSGGHFALVLLDAHMPEVDGFALSRRIQEDPVLITPRIVMLSSLDVGSLGPELRDSGHYIVKPVTRDNLLGAILNELGDKQEQPVRLNAIPHSTTVGPLHILLAEDNIVNQKVALRLLEKQGHSVEVASNGTEAVAALTRNDFDLVLMDVQMPVMNGYAATQAIRSAERNTGRRIPIVALTAHAMKGDREICLEAGMDDYLGKPIHPMELTAVIERLCRLSRMATPRG